MIVSGGYDRLLKFWDARQPNPTLQLQLPEHQTQLFTGIERQTNH